MAFSKTCSLEYLYHIQQTIDFKIRRNSQEFPSLLVWVLALVPQPEVLEEVGQVRIAWLSLVSELSLQRHLAQWL